ncbi:MAG: hypothetical protein AAGH15_05620 [Myxococcota bacterium]
MASKMVRDRQNSAELVLAVEAAQGGVLQRGLQQNVVGDAAEHAERLRAELRASLEAAVEAMVEADLAHEVELADDPAVREARDAAAAVVREQLVGLRLALSGFPPAFLEGVFQRQQTPQESRGLERYAGAVAKALGVMRLPEVRRTPGVTVSLDVDAAVAALGAARDGLTEALAAVAREVRQAQATKSARDRAMERYDRVFRAYATLLVLLFELAEERELADRVRPTLRRPGQVRDPEVDAETPSEDASTAANGAATRADSAPES